MEVIDSVNIGNTTDIFRGQLHSSIFAYDENCSPVSIQVQKSLMTNRRKSDWMTTSSTVYRYDHVMSLQCSRNRPEGVTLNERQIRWQNQPASGLRCFVHRRCYRVTHAAMTPLLKMPCQATSANGL